MDVSACDFPRKHRANHVQGKTNSYFHGQLRISQPLWRKPPNHLKNAAYPIALEAINVSGRDKNSLSATVYFHQNCQASELFGETTARNRSQDLFVRDSSTMVRKSFVRENSFCYIFRLSPFSLTFLLQLNFCPTFLFLYAKHYHRTFDFDLHCYGANAGTNFDGIATACRLRRVTER